MPRPRPFLLACLLFACAEESPPTPAPPAAPPAAPAAPSTPAAAPAVDLLAATSDPGGEPDLGRASAAARMVGLQLKQRMVKAMSDGGPDAAVRVCADEAQGLTALIQGRTGVRVGRSSRRLRNPANAGPDWVQAWLAENDGKPASEVSPMEAVVDTPEGRMARVALPIGVDAPCLLCHGASDTLAPGIRTMLSERYPDDAATGYAAGDLRGVLWAEATAQGG